MTALVHEHALLVSDVGGPLAGGNASLEHLVDLFERAAESLGNVEVDEGHGNEGTDTVDPTNLSAEVRVVEEVRKGEGDSPSNDPEASGTDRHDLATVLADSKLGSHDPGERTPGQIEEEDVDADHGSDGAAFGDTDDTGVGQREASSRKTLGTDTSHDEEGDEHGNRGGEDERSATEAVDEEERTEDTNDFDDIDNDGNDESVLETDGGHEGDCVREDELDTTDLLTDQDSEHAGKLAQLNTMEEGLPAALTRELELILTSLAERVVLESNDLVSDVVVLALVDALERSEGLLIAVLLDKPTGRLGNDELGADEDGNEEEVEDDWDAVRPCRVDVFGSLSNAGTDDLTDSKHQLPRRDDGATDGSGSDFGEIQGCAVRDHTDTSTENTTTEREKRFGTDSDELEDDTDCDESAGTEETATATDIVTQRRSNERADNFTCLHDRGVERLI